MSMFALSIIHRCKKQQQNARDDASGLTERGEEQQLETLKALYHRTQQTQNKGHQFDYEVALKNTPT